MNYYLFFPAHEQSADPTCTNIEALEFNCFAGEWGCISILLEQDQPGSDFVPSLIGCTGCFTSDNPNIAQAPDDGDAAKRIWMKVFPFTAATLVGQSPQLFVAKGTHSLYLQPGPVAVDFSDDSRPFLCATGEGTPVDQPDNSTNPFAPLGILLAKMMAGNGLLGPIGALAGLVAGIVEWTEGNFGLGVTGERGPVPNDVTADVSTGLIIRSPGPERAWRRPRSAARLAGGPRRDAVRSALRLRRRSRKSALVARSIWSRRLHRPLGTSGHN